MTRQARVVLPGVPHHITHRGNNHQTIFYAPGDFLAYLHILHEAATENPVEVHAYCLMPNRVHIVLTPETAPALAQTIQKTQQRYTLYLNDHSRRSGHLWQNRFYSCPLDDDHFWRALRYVECNPVRAGLAQQAWEYRWSSARAHIATTGTSRLLNLPRWREEMQPEEWKQVIGQEQASGEIEALRAHTLTGRPLGTTGFVEGAEAILGRSLRVKKVGRPAS